MNPSLSATILSAVDAADCFDLNDWLVAHAPEIHAPSKYLSSPFEYQRTAAKLHLAGNPELLADFVAFCPPQD